MHKSPPYISAGGLKNGENKVITKQAETSQKDWQVYEHYICFTELFCTLTLLLVPVLGLCESIYLHYFQPFIFCLASLWLSLSMLKALKAPVTVLFISLFRLIDSFQHYIIKSYRSTLILTCVGFQSYCNCSRIWIRNHQSHESVIKGRKKL